MTKKKLGDLIDGNRVFLDNILSGYIIQPLPNEKKGCRIFYANISDAKEVPIWAFKKFAQEKVLALFDSIIERLKTYKVGTRVIEETECKMINTFQLLD